MLKVAFLLFLLTATWVVNVLHMTCVPQYNNAEFAVDDGAPESFFLLKTPTELHHLFLFGTPYQRGLAAGKLTKTLLDETEDILFSEFFRFFPNPLLRWTFIVASLRWFAGADKFLPKEFLDEAYGISRSSQTKYAYILDPATLALAYHGVHEVGQFFVDVERDDFGCTVFAVKHEDAWVIGRNFDFEVGRFFDTNKVIKWHFPTEGFAYLSVIWPGMLGTVTGVNEQGVYISINAAGSEDFKRYGTPSTVVVTEALNKAASAQEAVTIIEAATVFVSDIFVVTDRHHTFRIEKTPARAVTTPLTADTAITNHLTDASFANDRINLFRRKDLTSSVRLQRGQTLLRDLDEKTRSNPKALERKVLSFLRDKKDLDGVSLHVGNRRAIDALIATHSVVYNSKDGILYVNKGPALAGAFYGYDVKASFQQRKPVRTTDMERDSEVSDVQFFQVKDSLKKIADAEQAITQRDCAAARKNLQAAASTYQHLGNYYTAYGKYLEICKDDTREAKVFYKKALALEPAYAKQRKFLNEKVF